MKGFTEIIDKYLHDGLNETDRAAFEKQLAKNPELQREVELQREIMKGINRYALKADIQTGIKKAKTAKLIKTLVIGVVTLAVTVLVATLVSKKHHGNQNDSLEYEINESGKAEWGIPDKVLPSQFFTINPRRDTVIETQSGIVFQLGANLFLDKFGANPEEPVEIEVKEAMTPADVIKSGLSTSSNGQLLETGGMFYINARQGNDNLIIDQQKSISVAVPASSNKEMMLFDGQRTADGTINWVQPRPLKRNLTTVDVMDLNFYPPHFLDTLAALGFDAKNKALTDSIYYSFGNYSICSENAYYGDAGAAAQAAPAKADSSRVPTQFPAPAYYSKDNDAFSKTVAVPPSSLQVYSVTASVNGSSNGTLQLSSGGVPKQQTPAPNGEKLFKQNCAVCHDAFTDRMLTGPGLKGVFDRVPKGDWLKRYILNNEKLIKSGDPYANKLYKQYGNAQMTVFEGTISDKDVDAILEYLKVPLVQVPEKQESCVQEINPSRIKAMWDRRFNNTFVATRQFEERLRAIFGTCNASFLELYLKNLNKPLYVLDSIAAYQLSGDMYEAQHIFYDFFSRRDGGVELSDDANKLLGKYLSEKQKIYDDAVKKTMYKLYKDEFNKGEEAKLREFENSRERALKVKGIYEEELKANLKEAYRQLGKQEPRTDIAIASENNMLIGSITTPGWKNVDQYVTEATAQRASMKYTDIKSGKTAAITYSPLVIKPAKKEDYDRIVCYLMPNNLSSFQLMKDTAGAFTEKLNSLFVYAMVVVGYKGEKTFYKDVQYQKPGEYSIDLDEIDPETLTRRLNARYSWAGTKDVIRDIDFGLFKQKEDIRIQKIANREKLRQRIFSVVYPCGLFYTPTGVKYARVFAK